ncbi:Vms1/Ankzf1 family peptidyl-tRNA hydrolase [Sanguibacter antarcticus]|uniref:Peptide subunit release factor 1 (ERF1) n=1 Tax=Sanguibacter antarcticus TaxID=372484 RepID=A0A2A9E431_9MICO|nr:Vms1/Ankzf1 family peptidyl-tRNA hydrolase [Sanguibacter antarcticus]PFG33604.1 hypothetical protein ATL42_1481 [Sanguibacter antarcticus]
MKIDWLKPLIGHDGPFVSVYLDSTPAAEAGDQQVEERWKGVRRALERDGAGSTLLDQIGEVLVRPTWVSGPHGRFLVADSQEILVDMVLAEPPVRDRATFGEIPGLLPAAHAADESVARLVVEVNREGADLTFVESARAIGGSLEALRHVVEGGHDEVVKAHTGGWSHRRVESRAEDSWERNTEVVAAEIDRLVLEKKPELVILTGDVRAVPLVRRALGKKTAELTVEVPGGSRNDGVKDEVFRGRLNTALDVFRTKRRETVLGKFLEEHGRDGAAVSALADVVAVLQRGQVEELIFFESEAQTAQHFADLTLWVGPELLQIATSRSDLEGIGVTDGIRKIGADVALLRAALGQDAGVTFAPSDGAVNLPDGVGAVLRWHDESTPSDGGAPSLSSDAGRLRTVG